MPKPNGENGFINKVGSRGRIVIPDDVREEKGIDEGDRVKLKVSKLDFEPKSDEKQPPQEEQRGEKKKRSKKTNFNVFG